MTPHPKQTVRSGQPNRSGLVRAPALVITLGVAMLVHASSAALAQTVSREQDIVDLRLGQRVMVDDGSCPAGQLKEVLGSTMTPRGITRTSKCVPRATRRK
jgi:hypothetical protein